MMEKTIGKITAEEALLQDLTLSKEFEQPPEVQLELITATPNGDIIGASSIAATTAYQCYSAKKPLMKDRSNEKRAMDVALSTLGAGHHTTRMHTNYTWRLKLSRSVVRDIFHGLHPFGNSEQQSQRYVPVEMGSFMIPSSLSDKQKDVYVQAAEFANGSYLKLVDLVRPLVEERVRDSFSEAAWKSERNKKRMEGKIGKLSLEVSRYALPIAQKTTLFHTLNEIQLLRLFRASKMEHFSDEARFVIAKMVNTVAEKDPSILSEIDKPLEEVSVFGNDLEKRGASWSRENIDSLLGERSSVLIDYPTNLKNTLTLTIRNILNVGPDDLSDEALLETVFNPEKSKLWADVFESGMLDPVYSIVRQAHFVFATKLSHTADSQRQRHRRTPGSTPGIEQAYNGEADFMIPLVIRENPKVLREYGEIMERIYGNVEKALSREIKPEHALLLLPNAHAIRVIESGDLFDWGHRLKQRLCFLAQEEIGFISMQQTKQILEVLPESKDILLAPCGIRKKAKVTPFCPEGDRYCGVRVWEFPIEKYESGRTI